LQNVLIKSQCVELEELNNLFIELCKKTCNLKCKHCYIKKDPYKKVKDFIHVDKIKAAIAQSKNENLKYIYLTGGEPLMHPNFNDILRLCLKRTNVTIMSNGICLNDKKCRFLRKIENEAQHEIVFRISIDHFEERKNDEIRGIGSFRKAIGAVQSLVKYEFNPVISVVNYHNTPENELREGFKALCKKINFELEEMNLKIVPNVNCANLEEVTQSEKLMPDCANSRLLNSNGIWACPLHSDDYRGRCGSDLSDFSKKVYLDSEFCTICLQYKEKMFTNEW